jgi:hypothetical protein
MEWLDAGVMDCRSLRLVGERGVCHRGDAQAKAAWVGCHSFTSRSATMWSWWVLPYNCASFVEDVVRAGGSKAGLYFNCPVSKRLR